MALATGCNPGASAPQADIGAPVADGEPVPAPPPPPPISDLLLTAAEKGAVGDRAAAIAAWRESYAGFEATIEPDLRKRCDSCATEIEYRFGLVRAEIGRPGGKPLALVEDLRKQLEPYLPKPPPPPEGGPVEAPFNPAPDVPPE